MILFQEDWHNGLNTGPDGDGPIVDYNTTNKSFLNYASLLHQMGIKNWAFCLALHDPKLQGVNPFDENLSDEMKYRIGIEMSNNPWYYLREAGRVPSSAGAEPLVFRAHRANIGMFWAFMNCVSIFLLQPRQTGKSVVADMINNYLLHYRMWNTKSILVTLSQTLLSANIERIKEMRDLLPQYTIARTANDSKAKETYNYPAKGNHLITKVSQNSEVAANNLGRGLTTAIQQYDEGAFISYMDVVWPAATAAASAARDLAIERGEPYGTIITTTAGDRMSRSGAFMWNIYQTAAPWTEHYFDLQNKEELHQVVRTNSKDGGLMIGATFNHLQLGYTDEWLKEKIRELKTTDQDKINRDYFNVWTTTGSLSPLPPDVAQDIMVSERNPDYTQITNDGYIVKWYIPMEEIGRYMKENICVMGADTSEAINRDATSFVVINVSTLETVCAISVSEADVIKLADFIVDFMTSFTKVTLIIEHKSTGGTFIETLYTKLPLYGHDPFRRIYNTIVQDREKHDDLFKKIADSRFKRNNLFYTQNKKKFGFMTTGGTRHVLMKDVLQVAVRRCRNIVYDKILSSELRSLEVDTRTGRVDHTADKHDDNVVAWLLAMWLLMHGKNLSFYGIDTSKVMLKVSEDGSKIDDTKLREHKLIESLQKDLDDLSKQLIDNRYTMYQNVIENKIRRINDKLSVFGVEPRTLDAILEDAKQKRLEELKRKRSANGQ